jgi:serine/threonine protein kinase
MIFVIAYWMKEEDLKERFEGKLYDRYEVLEVIGSGTFGKVYLVRSS